MVTFFINKAVISNFFIRYFINISVKLLIYVIKALTFSSYIALANLFFLIDLIQQVVRKVYFII